MPGVGCRAPLTGAHSSWGQRGSRKPLEIRAQEGGSCVWDEQNKSAPVTAHITPRGGDRMKTLSSGPKESLGILVEKDPRGIQGEDALENVRQREPGASGALQHTCTKGAG